MTEEQSHIKNVKFIKSEQQIQSVLSRTGQTNTVPTDGMYSLVFVAHVIFTGEVSLGKEL